MHPRRYLSRPCLSSANTSRNGGVTLRHTIAKTQPELNAQKNMVWSLCIVVCPLVGALGSKVQPSEGVWHCQGFHRARAGGLAETTTPAPPSPTSNPSDVGVLWLWERPPGCFHSLSICGVFHF
jgi:hypothetical protein